MTSGTVVAVCVSPGHTMSKPVSDSITLIAGLGIEGDAHAGATVKHRSRVAKDPTQANLRQVHLIHAELLDELQDRGFAIVPGAMGENITTRGLSLLAFPVGTVLYLGRQARVELTGLRNPCAQLDGLAPGLMQATLARDSSGNLIRKAGVMAIVLQGGVVCPGDAIAVQFPDEPHRPLAPV